MNLADIRRSFLDFFKSKGFEIIPSASLVPENDPTVLFNIAGMQPLVPYLLGEKHPKGNRLADSQKCVRTVDIDNIGDYSHVTFVEMLGHWSLGDYWKRESLEWIWQWLTDEHQLGLDPKRLYITVYKGDEQIPEDSEALEIWRGIFDKEGISFEGRYLKLGRDDNWWEIGGVDSSPAGPSSEVFYYLGDEENPTFDQDSTDFIEIGNTVFMAYQKQKSGKYSELENKNIDFGGGLERIAMVKQGATNIHDIDVLIFLRKKIEEYAIKVHHTTFIETDPESRLRAVRIIADHLRTITFMTADGVEPSNVGAGYVMRRLARRAIREGLIIGISHELLKHIVPTVIELYSEPYPELEVNKQKIIEVLDKEESKFRQTLTKGLREYGKELNINVSDTVTITDNVKIVRKDTAGNIKDVRSPSLTGEMLFRLFDTYGFPIELSIEEAKRLNIPIEKDAEIKFHDLMDAQRERSRTASAGQFKGGLADHSELSTRYHTATHLLYRALKNVLGDHVVVRGSNITQERARFDFSHPEKLTPEQIKTIEDEVNNVITRDLPVSYEEMPLDEAYANGALGAFGEKYPDVVKVYTVGDPHGDNYSKEICGGPHVTHTGEIGKFKIIKEESSSSGVRRIKAVIE